jgi:hypothetical protein
LALLFLENILVITRDASVTQCELGMPHEAFDRTSAFLETIGIQVRVVPGATGFLPGLLIQGATISVDAATDSRVGDLLHEAGHIAVTPGRFREHICNDVSSLAELMSAYLDEHPNAFGYPEDPIARAIMQSSEAEAIAWSYAAALESGVDPCLPFKVGFDGNGMEVFERLSLGMHFGVNGLAAAGMTDTPTRKGSKHPYPAMKKWMQD